MRPGSRLFVRAERFYHGTKVADAERRILFERLGSHNFNL